MLFLFLQITVGSQDGSIVQWAVNIDLLEETAGLADEPEEMFAPLQVKVPVNRGAEKRRSHDIDFMLDIEAEVPHGIEDRDKYLKEQHPWWSVAVPPSVGQGRVAQRFSEASLSLSWVLEMQLHLRQCVTYLHGNEIVYPAVKFL